MLGKPTYLCGYIGISHVLYIISTARPRILTTLAVISIIGQLRII